MVNIYTHLVEVSLLNKFILRSCRSHYSIVKSTLFTCSLNESDMKIPSELDKGMKHDKIMHFPTLEIIDITHAIDSK